MNAQTLARGAEHRKNKMSSKLQDELKQAKPFESLKREVLVNLARTAAVVTHQVELDFKEHGLTFVQYNVLRIIRGAGPPGIIQGEIRERLVTPTGDVPRVLARLEKGRLVRRTQLSRDSRFLTVQLTDAGFALLERVDRHTTAMDDKLFVNLSEPQLKTLNRLLNAARCPRQLQKKHRQGPQPRRGHLSDRPEKP